MANSGGKAVNSGVEYQQRVAASFLASMWLEFDVGDLVNIAGPLLISSVGFETNEPIDDLQLSCEDGTELFMQVKRRLSLSKSLTSDFGKAIEQFVCQHDSGDRATQRYLLVTTTESSSRVTKDLRLATDSVRLSSFEAAKKNWNMKQGETIDQLRGIVDEVRKANTKNAIADEEFGELLKLTHIVCFDVGDGMPMEKAMLLLLQPKISIEPTLVWALLIKNSLTYASTQSVVNIQAMKDLLQRFGANTNERADGGASRMKYRTPKRWCSGREIFLLDNFADSGKVGIVELFRFDSDGNVRNPIVEGKVDFGNGLGGQVLARAATFEGMNRLIASNTGLVGDKDVVIIEAKYSEDESPDDSELGLAHEKACISSFESLEEFDTCLHCGRTVNETSSNIIEIDEDGLPHATGLIHTPCMRPTDRIVGFTQTEGPLTASHLTYFDVRRWASKRQSGQRGLGNGVAMLSSGQGIIRLAWNPSNSQSSGFGYSVRLRLANESVRYVTARGRIDRMTHDAAKNQASQFEKWIAESQEAKNPMCYTSEQFIFGRYSDLLKQKAKDEECIECVSAEAVPYSATADKDYDTGGEWYAPIAYFTDSAFESVLSLGDLIPLVSDPLEAGRFLSNWAAAGFEIDDAQLTLLETDAQVDEFIHTGFANDLVPIVDPTLDKTPTLVSGMPFHNVADMLKERK